MIEDLAGRTAAAMARLTAASTPADEPDMAALRSGLAPLLRSPPELARPGVPG